MSSIEIVELDKGNEFPFHGLARRSLRALRSGFINEKCDFMPKKYRDPFEPEQHYHIYHRVVSGERLFHNGSDYLDFLERYKKYLQPFFNTWAYCLIPNHYHFLVKVKSMEELLLKSKVEKTNASKQFIEGKKSFSFFIENQLSRMLSGIALRYNKKHKRNGPLFEQGIKRVCITSEQRIAYQIAYIHHNPIHHGISNSFDEWVYSSYNTFVNSGKTNVSVKEVLAFLGGMDTFHWIHKEYRLDTQKSEFYEDLSVKDR